MKKRDSSYRFSHQQGLTLVELLISLLMSMGVLVALASVYVAARQSYRFQDTASRLQEDANFALDTLTQNLRMAGMAGCRGVDMVTPITGVDPVYFPHRGLSNPLQSFNSSVITGPNPMAQVFPTESVVLYQPLSPANFVRGFDTIPSAFFSSGSAPTSVVGSSIFFSGGSANGVSVKTAMATTNSPLTIAVTDSGDAPDPMAWGGDSRHYIVSDCVNSSLFVGRVSSGGTEIDHGAVLGNLSDAFPNNAIYDTNAIVMPLEWSFYYVATRSGAATPSLYRITYNGSSRSQAEEVVANVESMRLHYGENINGIDFSAGGLSCTIALSASCTPSLQADVWRTDAASVTDWSRVVAIRIGLMMVSADNAANLDGIVIQPTLLDQPYTAPNGSSATRLRKEFSTTVVLRNRVAAR